MANLPVGITSGRRMRLPKTENQPIPIGFDLLTCPQQHQHAIRSEKQVKSNLLTSRNDWRGGGKSPDTIFRRMFDPRAQNSLKIENIDAAATGPSPGWNQELRSWAP